MEFLPDERTVVIAGSWNLAILNPLWAAKEIFAAENVEVEVLVGQGQTNLKYTHDNIALVPRTDRVIFSAIAHSDECLLKMEALAVRLLELLPITPVSAMGINFGFLEPQIPDAIAQMFNTLDVPQLAERNLASKSMSLLRHLSYDDRELRLRLTMTEESTLKVHLNFHKPVGTAAQAREAVFQKTQPFRDFGLETLAAVYGLNMEPAQ